jgi:uncharacterized protein
MKDFPAKSYMRWRRLNGAGHEETSIERTARAWRLTGRVDTEEAGIHAELEYAVECDREWRTRRALVTGSASTAPVRLELLADGEGHWTLNGAPLPSVEGALDVDLGFTPATNLLPIRRLQLAVGEQSRVRAAWVRYPELRVEALEQWYRRESKRVFRYEALLKGERFQARLETDEFGSVLIYEGLWEAAVGLTPA